MGDPPKPGIEVVGRERQQELLDDENALARARERNRRRYQQEIRESLRVLRPPADPATHEETRAAHAIGEVVGPPAVAKWRTRALVYVSAPTHNHVEGRGTPDVWGYGLADLMSVLGYGSASSLRKAIQDGAVDPARLESVFRHWLERWMDGKVGHDPYADRRHELMGDDNDGERQG